MSQISKKTSIEQIVYPIEISGVLWIDVANFIEDLWENEIQYEKSEPQFWRSNCVVRDSIKYFGMLWKTKMLNSFKYGHHNMATNYITINYVIIIS